MSETMSDLQNTIGAWHKHERPEWEPMDAIYECGAAVDSICIGDATMLDCADEAADVFIALAAYCALKGIDLEAATRAKLKVLRTRTWGEPDARGVAQHVEAGV